MKKFLLTALVAASLPVMAYTVYNHNALSTGPVMSEEYQTPAGPEKLNALQRAKEDSIVLAEKQLNAESNIRKVAADGTALPTIVASVYDYSTGSIGMYRLPEVVGGEMELLTDAVSSYYGGTLKGNLYYACHDGRYDEYWDTDSDPHGHKIQAYDIDTWQPVGNELNLRTYRASDLAVSPVDGLAYAYCDYGSIMFRLFKINLETGAQTDVNPSTTFLSDDPRALSFMPDGTLYAIDKTGYFGTVNMTTGKLNKISNLGLSGSSQYGWTMDYDIESGNFMFMFNNASVSQLYSIVPETGEATLLAEWTGKCITSMFILPETAADGAPGLVSDLSTSFVDGALSGTVSFTMPTTLLDGTAATGNATWTVYTGKEVLATGQAAYGAEVTANVTVAATGKYTFAVAATNDAGEGKKERITTWVGPDSPKAPENIKVDMDEDNGRYTISWNAVTEGANGGYVDPAAVTYTVVRMPSDVVVAEKVSETTVVDNYTPTGIESVYYAITAYQGDAASATANSDAMVSGSMPLPYDKANYSDASVLDGWTILDLNGDGNTWSYYYGDVRYKYDSKNTADDWLITPPMKAIEGNKYFVHIGFKPYGSRYPEKVEIKAGYGASADAMTIECLEPTVIDQEGGQTFDFVITPDRNGKFFMGIHALSDPDQYYLYLTELTISAPVNEASPAAPVITSVTADRSGALSATGTVLVPNTAENGTALYAISKVEVRRNGIVVDTIDNPAPGSTVEFTDDIVAEDGVCGYVAYAYNGDFVSQASEECKTFVGVNRAAEIENIVLTRDATDPAKLVATWNVPEFDVNGYPLNGSLTYSVEVYPDNAYYHGNKTYTDIPENTFVFEPTFETGLDHGFAFIKVQAVNRAGSSWAKKSNNMYAGKPIAAPFKESFPNYTLEHPWGDGESNGPQIASISDDERAMSWSQYNGWNRLMDASFQSASGSQDGDNGFAGMFGWSYVNDEFGNMHNEYTELLSPYIDLSTIEKPTLTFYTYNWFKNGFSDPNQLDVYAVTADGACHEVLHLVIGELGSVEDWMYVTADLSQYAGQTIGLIFKGTICAVGDKGYNWVLIDNIRIERLPGVDLAVSDIVAPVQAVPNEEFTVEARVTNLGTADAASHTAILSHNGVEIAKQDLAELGASKFEVVEFKHALSVQDPIGNVFTISVVADNDEVAENNTSAEVTVARNLQLLPEPAAVYINPEADRLEWLEPDYDYAVPAAVLDDFESYPCYEADSFLTEAGNWIFIDLDGLPIGGMINGATYEMLEFPGIPNYSKQSWWVQSRLFNDFNDTYYGYDYSLQYLANMYVVNESHTAGELQDDWAISPELCGREQLVTLWARSYNWNTLETVEFLYSEGSTDPSAFKLIRRIEELPGDWTQYALVVPEGGRRFAIRGCSYAPLGTAQTFIDNVSFYPFEGEAQDLELTGYNVYCDNVLLNSAPVSDLEFVELPAGEHNYAVSAVYTTGESRAVAAVEGSGIGLNDAGKLRVAAKDGKIVITGLDGAAYTVASVVGVVYGNGAGSDSAEVAVPAGIYVVKVANRTVKLVVK